MRKYGVFLAAWSVLGILFFLYLYYSEYGTFPDPAVHWGIGLLSILLANLAGGLVRSLDHLLNRVLAWRSLFFTRFIAGFVLNTVGVMLLTAVAGYTFVTLMNTRPLDAVYFQWHEEIWKLGILVLTSLLLYEVFYGWYYSYRYFMVMQVEQLKSERWQMELQFQLLKNQISPHYLFNCLNTISSLLYTDPVMAEEFIRRMADTFRYVLGNRKNKLVPLREELEFVKAYHYLLQVRYQHYLQLEINLPSGLSETLVPPMALQILMENAVKHNEISKSHPLYIYISAQDNTYINVSSTKTVPVATHEGFRIGLDNVRNRYKFFTDVKVIVKDQEKFVVQLPVIKPASIVSDSATLDRTTTS
jgi:two-component system, LytTR family, sensor kinase